LSTNIAIDNQQQWDILSKITTNYNNKSITITKTTATLTTTMPTVITTIT
jgi:hypothetical protein